MRAATIAVVPLRSPGEGKTRLAGMLDAAQRADLTRAMLADVVEALHGARGVDGVLVAAGGPPAAAAARALGLDTTNDPEPGAGLDAALAAACRLLAPTAPVLVVNADLPLLTAGDVTAVLETDAEVVVAPGARGGTGGLLRRPHGRIPTAYGGASAARHLALAERYGASCAVVDRTGLHHDVDTWADLLALGTAEPGPHTARVLGHLLGAGASPGRGVSPAAGGSHAAVRAAAPRTPRSAGRSPRRPPGG